MRIALRVLASLICGVLFYYSASFVFLMLAPRYAGVIAFAAFLIGVWLPWHRRHPQPKAMSHTAQQSQEQ